MAQLKDTIINGDLTVTGSIVSESIEAAVAPATDNSLGTVKGDGNKTINILSDGSIKVNDNGHNHTSLTNVTKIEGTTGTSDSDTGLQLSGGGLTMALQQTNELNFTGSGTTLMFNHQNASGASSGNFTTIRIGNGKAGYGTVEAGTFNASSDKRLKENLSPYKYDNSILDLPVYTFDYVNGQKNQLGCMAQDLQKICPEIVNEGENGYLSIQESKIVYLLLMEVKKLKEELNTLKIKE